MRKVNDYQSKIPKRQSNQQADHTHIIQMMLWQLVILYKSMKQPKVVVTEVDVPESEIADFKDKVKTIVGKVVENQNEKVEEN